MRIWKCLQYSYIEVSEILCLIVWQIYIPFQWSWYLLAHSWCSWIGKGWEEGKVFPFLSLTTSENGSSSFLTHFTQLHCAVLACLPGLSWDLIGLVMDHNYVHAFIVLLRSTARFIVIYFFMTNVQFYLPHNRPNNDLLKSLWLLSFCLSFSFFLFFNWFSFALCVHTWILTKDSCCTYSQLKIQPYSQLVFLINQSGENSSLSCWSFLCKAHVSLQGLSRYWFCQFASITVQKQRRCAHNINSQNRKHISQLWFTLVKKDDWKNTMKMQCLEVEGCLTVPKGERNVILEKLWQSI